MNDVNIQFIRAVLNENWGGTDLERQAWIGNSEMVGNALEQKGYGRHCAMPFINHIKTGLSEEEAFNLIGK